MLEVGALLVLVGWMLQGLHTAGLIRKDGYHPMWWLGTGLAAVALLIPAVALFV